jgi:hypothetical protein
LAEKPLAGDSSPRIGGRSYGNAGQLSVGAQTRASLTSFWIDQIHCLLQRLLSILTSDKEVLVIPERQELLAKLAS